MIAIALATAFFFAQNHRNDNLPDIPKNHWVYEMLATCKKVDVYNTIYREGSGNPPRPRYQIATTAFLSTIVFCKRVDESDEASGFDLYLYGDVTAQKRLEYARNLSQAGEGLHRLLIVLAPDMPRYLSVKELDQELQKHRRKLRQWLEHAR